ncbi:holin [Glutamicibacter sp. ZJUTW]|uniref:holin n=1 Tax=Glutamicibacter sp. ZJUTW TaxID=1155384 RepID=UPI0011F2E614|nr:holin [Glutamicibacter sp. ZJUTW]QEP08725.1 hypothetical protein F0M17_16570 [Glutamicibacter sp. ZJUTW]
MLWTKEFWKGVAERGIKTGAQFALLTLGVGVTAGTVDGEAAQVINAFAVDFVTLGGAFLGGVLVSVLTSLVFSGNVPNKSMAKHLAD